MSLSLHLELADFVWSSAQLNAGYGWRSTNHVVPFQNSLPAAHKGVCKGTLIDDYVRPEENNIRRRFLSDEGSAFTLLFFFSKVATDISLRIFWRSRYKTKKIKQFHCHFIFSCTLMRWLFLVCTVAWPDSNHTRAFTAFSPRFQ